MRNIDATTITWAFLQRPEACADPRLKHIHGSLVTHLHNLCARPSRPKPMQGHSLSKWVP